MKTLNSILRLKSSNIDNTILTTLIIKINPLFILNDGTFDYNALDSLISVLNDDSRLNKINSILYIYDFNQVGSNLLEVGSDEFRRSIYTTVDALHSYIKDNTVAFRDSFIYYKLYGTSSKKTTRFFRPIYNYLMVTKCDFYKAVMVCSSHSDDDSFADMAFLNLIRI